MARAMEADRPRRGRWVPGALLVLFALASLVHGFVRELSRPAPSTPREEGAPTAAVTVTYFHGDVRCKTCRAIEARTERWVRSSHATEVAEQRLRYRKINFDRPEHEALRDRYELAAGGVVITAPGPEGSWEQLYDVWTLVLDEETQAFEDYLEHSLRPFLEEQP